VDNKYVSVAEQFERLWKEAVIICVELSFLLKRLFHGFRRSPLLISVWLLTAVQRRFNPNTAPCRFLSACNFRSFYVDKNATKHLALHSW